MPNKKNKINTFNISGLSVNSGVNRNKLTLAITKGTGKVLTQKERNKVIDTLYKSVFAVEQLFSDAESL